MRIPNIIKFFPWSLKEIKNIGTNWYKNEPYMEKEKSVFIKNIVSSDLDSDLDETKKYLEKKNLEYHKFDNSFKRRFTK